MRVFFVLTLLTFSFCQDLFAQQDFVVDTCDCPSIEDLSHNVHDILNSAYQRISPERVPVEFDELTLVMDLQERSEIRLSCSESFGVLSNYERSLGTSLEGEEVDWQSLFGNQLKLETNLAVGEFDPSLVRLATENDRTLLFRVLINGETKYAVMRVDREGQARIALLEEAPSAFEVPSESQEISQRIDLSFPISGEATQVDEEVISAPVSAPVIRSGQLGDIMPEGGTRVIAQPMGVGLERALVTNDGNLAQAGVALTLRGASPQVSEEGDVIGEADLSGARVDLAFRSVTSLRAADGYFEADESGVVEYEEHVSAQSLELRADVGFEFDQQGETASRDLSLGTTFRSGDDALSFDTQFIEGESARPYQLRLTNDEGGGGAGAIDSQLGIQRPRLQFGSIPGVMPVGQQTPSGGKGAPTTLGENDDHASFYSIGIDGDMDEGAQRVDFTLASEDDGSLTHLQGRYDLTTEDMSLRLGTGGVDERIALAFRDSEYAGQEVRIDGYRRTEPVGEGATTNEFMPHISLSETAPNTVGFDNIRTATTERDDGLVSQTSRVQSGVRVSDDQSVTLSYGRTTDTTFGIDPTVGRTEENARPEFPSGIQEYGSIQTHFAGELSFSPDQTSGQVVGIRSQELHGQTEAFAVGLAAAVSDEGHGVELAIATSHGDRDFQTNCSLAVRTSVGGVSAPSSNFQLGSARNSLNCGLVLSEDDIGASADLEVSYSFIDEDNSSYANFSLNGQFREDEEPDVSIGFELGMRFKSGIEDEEDGKEDEGEEKDDVIARSPAGGHTSKD